MGYKFNPFTGNFDEVDTTAAAGSDTQIQFNDGGKLAGDPDLTYNKTTNLLTSKGDISLDDGGSFTTTLQTITSTADRVISFPDATGTVALVAGSSGQLLYNNAGALAGASTLTTDGTNITLSGRFISSLNGATSAPPAALTGTWFTGGTATTTKPQFLIEPAGTTSTGWSTSGTGLGINAPSGFTGNLLDLQLNGASQVRVVPSDFYVTIGSRGISCAPAASNGFSLLLGGLNLSRSSPIYFREVATNVATIYTSLFCPGSGLLEQRNSTNAQTFRCYGTYTDASNYVRAALSSTSTAVTLAAETAGTGADDIPLNLTAAGSGTVKVNSVAEVAVSSTVAGLPASPAVGMLTRVTDADAPAVGSTVAGGGAAAALVWYDGANWTVVGGEPTPISSPSSAGLAPATSFAAINYAASVELDMAALNGQYRTISLTGDLELTTANRAAGQTLVLRLIADGTERTLTFPVGWVFVGTKPSTIAASKTGVLSLTFFGTADTDCVAAWGVQS